MLCLLHQHKPEQRGYRTDTRDGHSKASTSMLSTCAGSPPTVMLRAEPHFSNTHTHSPIIPGTTRATMAPTAAPATTTSSSASAAAAAAVLGDDFLQETTTLLQSLIRNACVNNGDGTTQEIRNIQTLQTFFDGYGIPYATHHPPDKPHRPSLIAAYPASGGQQKGPRVMLGPGHVDVVPVTEKDWDVPPFEARVVDGVLWGRGAVDMLNTVAAQAVVFARIVQAKVPLAGTLLFVAVSDEEAGGKDGAGFVVNDPVLRKVYQADYCLTEFGGSALIDRRGEATTTYVQANGEKGMAVVHVVCKGLPGHGSIPKNGDNALVKAAGVVACLDAHWTPTIITPQWRALMAVSDAPSIVRFLLTSTWLAPWLIRLLLALGHPLGPVAHAATRLTISPNHLTGTVKYNVVPGAAVVEVDCRTMPGQDEAYVVHQIQQALGQRRLASGSYEIKVTTFNPATTSSIDTPLWRAMETSAQELVPGAQFAPSLLTGATDSRYFRRAYGAVAYGTSLFRSELTLDHFVARVHGNNERIGLDSLGLSVQFFALTILRLMGGGGEEGKANDKDAKMKK